MLNKFTRLMDIVEGEDSGKAKQLVSDIADEMFETTPGMVDMKPAKLFIKDALKSLQKGSFIGSSEEIDADRAARAGNKKIRDMLAELKTLL